MSKVARIILGHYVRQTKTIFVEVPDDFETWGEADQQAVAHALYKADDGGGFEDDPGSYGAEESSLHEVSMDDGDTTPIDWVTRGPNGAITVHRLL
jgi:hypothetical protein